MGIKPMLQEFPQEREPAHQFAPYGCHLCAFYREVELTSGKMRLLCMLTGEKRPVAGMAGCNFIPGQWRDIDRILLAKSRVSGNTIDPNIAKPGSGFSGKTGLKIAKKDAFYIDDFFGKPINHIAERQKGSLVRPEYREVPVARNARERT